MQTTERDRLMNTSTNNMKGKKAEQHADQNNQLSSSLTRKLLSNEELRGVLADEIKSTGVLTATGYQAVLQKLLLSESVAREIIRDETGDDDASEAEKRLFMAIQRKGSSTTPSNSNLLPKNSGWEDITSYSAGVFEPHSMRRTSAVGSKSTPQRKMRPEPEPAPSSRPRVPFQNFFLGAKLEDELDDEKRRKKLAFVSTRKDKILPYHGSDVVSGKSREKGSNSRASIFSNFSTSLSSELGK